MFAWATTTSLARFDGLKGRNKTSVWRKYILLSIDLLGVEDQQQSGSAAAWEDVSSWRCWFAWIHLKAKFRVAADHPALSQCQGP